MSTAAPQFKRIVVCCDGTWMNSIGEKGADPPSNVTRIARVLKRRCHTGHAQVILYDSGVGSSSSKVDQLTGGAFGMGLDDNIREVYNFICNNYVDGDEIVLIGFSRGAFTARSVADLICTFGLLTLDGLDHFYPIFNDYENIGDIDRKPETYFYKGLHKYDGDTSDSAAKAKWIDGRKKDYLKWLKLSDDKTNKPEYSRNQYKDEAGIVRDIKVKAIAVWDTVGTLGIPPAPIVGMHGSAKQWKFSNTEISVKVENAFQALALDEPRFAFRPALWERPDGSPTNLKQVWFPGNHGGVGGGWFDQQLSDITLAWMCDQLASIGIEFNFDRLSHTFAKTLEYSAVHPFPFIPPVVGLPTTHYVTQQLPLPLWTRYLWTTKPNPWAVADLYTAPNPPSGPDAKTPAKLGACDTKDCDHAFHQCDNHQVLLSQGARTWGLGQIRFPTSFMQCFVGSWVRTPGMGVRVNPDTNEDLTDRPLRNTAERIHSCVRVRLACGGLGLDDKAAWTCEALTNNPTRGKKNKTTWQLVPGSALKDKERALKTPPELLDGRVSEYGKGEIYEVAAGDSDWKWVFTGDVAGSGEIRIPQELALPEEPLAGFWERYLLALTSGKGKRDVWRWAQDHPPK